MDSRLYCFVFNPRWFIFMACHFLHSSIFDLSKFVGILKGCVECYFRDGIPLHLPGLWWRMFIDLSKMFCVSSEFLEQWMNTLPKKKKKFSFLSIRAAWILYIELPGQHCLNKGCFYKNNVDTIEILREIFPNWKDRTSIKCSFGHQRWKLHGQYYLITWNYLYNWRNRQCVSLIWSFFLERLWT